jgi:Raf kinase inhibitor-like YbhB/YbcL family protein
MNVYHLHRTLFIPALLGMAVACTRREPERNVEAPVTIQLTSSGFSGGQTLPAKYTCEGENVSPPLEWSGVPAGTRSLALVLEDPDAPDPANPKTTWVHWIVYNLPRTTRLAENARQLPAGALIGRNDWGKTEYGGPCPPVGRHRYVHRLYALDVILPDLGGPTRADLLRAMEGHVLGQGELIGMYRKTR